MPLGTAMALVIASEGTVTSYILLHICQFKSNLESLFFKWTSYIAGHMKTFVEYILSVCLWNMLKQKQASLIL